MNLFSTSGPRLYRLLWAVCDGVATDEQRNQLEAAIADSDAVCDLYLRFMALHVDLAWRGGPIESAHAWREILGQPVRPAAMPIHLPGNPWRSRITGPRLAVTLAAGVLFVAYIVGLSWNLWGDADRGVMLAARGTREAGGIRLEAGDESIEPSSLKPQVSSLAPAYVVASENATWRKQPQAGPPAASASDQPSIATGEPLSLASGLVELKLQQGVTLLVEGPAEWSIRGANKVSLERGKLVAKVPTQAIGFTVKTPAGDVVDLGTEFGVSATSDGRTDVRVFRGEVRLTPSASSRIARQDTRINSASRLVAGESACLTSAAQQSPAASDRPVQFTREIVPAQPLQFGESVIAYQVPAGIKGNQDFAGSLGMDFDVLETVEVTALGAFDDGGDGFAPGTSISVQIWQRNSMQTSDKSEDDRGEGIAVEQVFTAKKPGKLIGGSRFLPLKKPLRLWPGSFTIVARGFNADDELANAYQNEPPWSCDDGGGSLRFVGTSRFGADAYPGIIDQQWPNRYAAGTFEFKPVLQPAAPAASVLHP